LTSISGNPNLVVKYKIKIEFPGYENADQVSDEISTYETMVISYKDLPKEC